MLVGRAGQPRVEPAREGTARPGHGQLRFGPYEHDSNGTEDEKAALYRELNRDAHFSVADYSDPESPCLPSLTIAGAYAYFYIDDDGTLQVSVHLDSITAVGTHIWGETSVPLRITCEDTVLFSSTGTWVIQFQHPDDGGNDGVWECSVPAQEAPTEAEARAVATQRFLTEISAHANADAWDGITIRSVRLTDHPPTS
ncbi:hypothetical protein [Streptomyces sp. 4F14]|uniref:hypothetical protein n=1 Tax=Streptomyces sp. 4F14 TaxID=3394380 RepID=UPI003A87B6CD